MEIGEIFFLATIGLSGLLGSLIGIEQGWESKNSPKASFLGALGCVIAWGFFALLIGGTLPWVKPRAYLVILFSGTVSGSGAYLGVKLANTSRTMAKLTASPIAGVLAVLVVYLNGLEL